MSFKKWNVCNPCCCTGIVNFTLQTCGRNNETSLEWWGNIEPPYVTPSSVQVFLSVCNSSTPTSEIFYPLVDLSASGKHTFHFGAGCSQLNILIDSGLEPSPNSHYRYQLNCDNGEVINITSNFLNGTTFDSWITSGPCSYHTVGAGATFKYTYNRPYQSTLLDLYNGVNPTVVCCRNTLSCTTSYQYTWDNTICEPVTSNVFDTCCFVSLPSNPPGNSYYKVIKNPASVDFKITPDSPHIPFTFLYYSDIKLLYAYVLYYPKDTIDLTPLERIGPFCDKGVAGQYPPYDYALDMAFVYFEYGGILDSFSPGIRCDFPFYTVLPAPVPGLQAPQNVDCGYFGGIFGIHCHGSFCGDSAFSDAEDFANSLPDTLQFGEYGSYIAYDTPYPIDSFFPDNVYFSNVSTNCPSFTINGDLRVAYDNNNPGNILFSGYNSLTINPSK